MIAPTIGANQNNQSCVKAVPPTKRAWDVERAGFTEVLVIGIEIKWINVNAKPIAIPANLPLAHLSVAPMITIKKNAVNTASAKKAAQRE